MKLHKDMRKMRNALKFREKMQVEEIILYKNGTADPVCPRCKIPLDREFMSFCDSCGQRLGWKEFDFAKAAIYLQ